MAKNNVFKRAVFVMVLAGLSISGVYAQITVSGGFALSTMAAKGVPGVSGSVGVGGNVYLDYLLPINIPLSIGLEVGADSAALTFGGDEDKVLAMPILVRGAYHFDLFPKLDFYLVGKLGGVFGFVTSGPDKEDFKSAGGFAFGIDAGAAYYFTSIVGAFAEVGFDGYMAKSKFDGGITVDTPFYRFFTLGISFKR
jgi:hypothetical protein